MIDIIYSDSDIIVVSKPSGMFVHPSPGHETGTLSSFLVSRFPEMSAVGSESRPGVVHRLDAGTSGVMVFARNRRAYLTLRKMFESHDDIVKTYLAVHRRALNPAKGEITLRIGRKPWDPHRMAVDVPDGKYAVSSWETLGRNGGFSLVEWKIKTGRMHQIRVTAAHLGAPIAGDELYGDPNRDRSGRLLLHAVSISFPHPATGRRMEFSVPPPPEIIYPSAR